jgi:hypothetical protein
MNVHSLAVPDVYSEANSLNSLCHSLPFDVLDILVSVINNRSDQCSPSVLGFSCAWSDRNISVVLGFIYIWYGMSFSAIHYLSYILLIGTFGYTLIQLYSV